MQRPQGLLSARQVPLLPQGRRQGLLHDGAFQGGPDAVPKVGLSQALEGVVYGHDAPKLPGQQRVQQGRRPLLAHMDPARGDVGLARFQALAPVGLVEIAKGQALARRIPAIDGDGGQPLAGIPGGAGGQRDAHGSHHPVLQLLHRGAGGEVQVAAGIVRQ